MVQLGQHLQLDLLPLRPAGAVGRVQLAPEHLDRDVPGQQLVPGSEHLGHPAGTDPAQHPVALGQQPTARLRSCFRVLGRGRLGHRHRRGGLVEITLVADGSSLASDPASWADGTPGRAQLPLLLRGSAQAVPG